MCKRRVGPGILVAVVVLGAATGCKNKAVNDLVRDISTNAPETATVGRALQTIAVLEQAEGLDSLAQCRAARDIYCSLFQMVRDDCVDQTAFCQTVADALFGGSFPAFGMRTCTSVAADKCSELQGHEVELQRLCVALRTTACE